MRSMFGWYIYDFTGAYRSQARGFGRLMRVLMVNIEHEIVDSAVPQAVFLRQVDLNLELHGVFLVVIQLGVIRKIDLGKLLEVTDSPSPV